MSSGQKTANKWPQMSSIMCINKTKSDVVLIDNIMCQAKRQGTGTGKLDGNYYSALI